ncbi:GlxA family transcriptional regulator [Candidatus Pelagadaptatus aseana]|uniref:GlxA family transcriptional regulator n=1 Tax=Candidatus Pelagadaptatus aseana TaxID=3120508 RepID=UPI003C700CE5
MTACHQFALGLIETQVSPEVANLSAKTLLINQRQINQSPFQELNVAIATDDPLIEKAQYKLKNHLQKEVDFTLLARELGVSQRTLIRRFKQVVGDTPLSYLQNLRIEHAKNLLENSPLTVGDIVLEVGYTDVSAFNRLFRQRVGLPPSVYRQQFSTMA